MVLAVVFYFLHSRYFKNPYLVVDIPLDEAVGKKPLQNYVNICSCSTYVTVPTFLFRVKVVNEFACAINRVRLYCDYRDDASYFLKMRHDNSYRKSDVGELLGPLEDAVFDLATVVCPGKCQTCDLLIEGKLNFEFADAALPLLFGYEIVAGTSLKVDLSASGLEPSGHAVAATKVQATFRFLEGDCALDISH